MNSEQLVEFIRQRGLAVVATRGGGGGGEPQAALVGVAANITADQRVALVIGWDDEVPLQCEGLADLPQDEDLLRCTTAYFEQYPGGRQRAASPDITHVRVRPRWMRYSDYRPDSFTAEVTTHMP